MHIIYHEKVDALQIFSPKNCRLTVNSVIRANRVQWFRVQGFRVQMFRVQMFPIRKFRFLRILLRVFLPKRIFLNADLPLKKIRSFVLSCLSYLSYMSYLSYLSYMSYMSYMSYLSYLSYFP